MGSLRRFSCLIVLLGLLGIFNWAMAQETQIAIKPGWNLLSSPYSFQVSNVFEDAQKFESIWKWIFEGAQGAQGNWAVYLPGQVDGGKAYAEQKNSLYWKG